MTGSPKRRIFKRAAIATSEGSPLHFGRAHRCCPFAPQLIYHHGVTVGTEKSKRKGNPHISRHRAKIAKSHKKENIRQCILNIE